MQRVGLMALVLTCGGCLAGPAATDLGSGLSTRDSDAAEPPVSADTDVPVDGSAYDTDEVLDDPDALPDTDMVCVNQVMGADDRSAQFVPSYSGVGQPADPSAALPAGTEVTLQFGMYNRWDAFADYPELLLTSDDPCVHVTYGTETWYGIGPRDTAGAWMQVRVDPVCAGGRVRMDASVHRLNCTDDCPAANVLSLELCVVP
jgi:hypothetical protein